MLKAKHDAGAEFAVTEMVLRASDYVDLVERARAAGVDFPIVPGIMPILNLASMRRMVELSGREIPDDVLARILPLQDDPAALRAEGVRIATELCDTLLEGGAPGLHFYTLNRSKATREIFRRCAWPVLTPRATPRLARMTRTVTVTGQGSARVVPDIAVVRLAAAHRAADVAGALAGVDDAVATAGAVARRFTDRRGGWPAPTSRSGRPTTSRARRPATRPATACASSSTTSPPQVRC